MVHKLKYFCNRVFLHTTDFLLLAVLWEELNIYKEPVSLQNYIFYIERRKKKSKEKHDTLIEFPLWGDTKVQQQFTKKKDVGLLSACKLDKVWAAAKKITF